MDGKYYLDKLMKMPAEFNILYQEKRYAQAKRVYDTAVQVALFLEVPEETKIQLFGSKQDENNIVNGLFNEYMVQKCYYEVSVKRQASGQ